MPPPQAVVDYSPYDKRCLGEGASAADLWACQKGLEKSHTPLLKGLYASQLERWQRAFGESQVQWRWWPCSRVAWYCLSLFSSLATVAAHCR